MKAINSPETKRYGPGKAPYLGVKKGKIPCDVCRKPVTKTDAVTVVTTPTSWFRGDDEVAFHNHADCLDVKGKT